MARPKLPHPDSLAGLGNFHTRSGRVVEGYRQYRDAVRSADKAWEDAQEGQERQNAAIEAEKQAIAKLTGQGLDAQTIFDRIGNRPVMPNTFCQKVAESYDRLAVSRLRELLAVVQEFRAELEEWAEDNPGPAQSVLAVIEPLLEGDT